MRACGSGAFPGRIKMKKKSLEKELMEAYGLLDDAAYEIMELDNSLSDARHVARTWKLVAKKWRERALKLEATYEELRSHSPG